MGLFDKLFGKEEKANEFKGYAELEPVQMSYLRQKRSGGYDKNSTLAVIDQLQSEIYALQEMRKMQFGGGKVTLGEAKQFYLPQKTNRGGFDEDDVETLFKQYEAKIVQIRNAILDSDRF